MPQLRLSSRAQSKMSSNTIVCRMMDALQYWRKLMACFDSYSQQPWREYYALRNRARLSLLVIPICLYLLLVKPPAMLLDRLNNLPESLKLIVVLVSIGLATIVFAAPVLKWVEWRCPRCGEKFV